MAKLVLNEGPGKDKLKDKGPEEKWKVMIVDDEPDIHSLTHMVLNDFSYKGKQLEFVGAYSGEEARKMIEEDSDITLILLDVVMEEEDSGLKLVEHIRNELKNNFVRIILRTGQPGQAPEGKVMSKYDINDYKSKTELTDQKLFTTVTSALRSYSDMKEIDSFRKDLEIKVEERTIELHEKNEKLVQLNQEKNNFLGMVSHDLRNPLNGISGYTNIILEEFQDLKEEEVQYYLGNIDDCVQRMLGLISNLLDVNAIESGNRKLSFEKFDLIGPLQSIVNDFQNSAKEKEINLIYTPFEGECIVYGDMNTSKQILENLISNAIKYSPPNKNVYVNINKVDEKVRCEVKDEGPGLNEDDKQKLFGKFARLSAQPTADESSTGLGLFIVKKLIEEMNGKVWCESEHGKGANFIVEFD